MSRVGSGETETILMVAASVTTDGGMDSTRDFEAAAETARSLNRYEFDTDGLGDIASPGADAAGLDGTLAWAMAPTWTVLRESLRSDRLDDEDGAAPIPPRTPRTFLFGRDGEDDQPAFVVRGSFVNRYDDERVAVETPAPWDTPDDMTSGNDIVKSLPWGEDETDADDDRDGAHYTFEDRVRQRGVDVEDVWVLDSDYAEDLRQMAEDAGYEWVEDPQTATSADEEALVELCQFLRPGEVDRDEWELVGGDEVTVRYESKQTGSIKQKSGMVNSTSTSMPGFAFERDDGKTNRVKADDGEVGIYSTSQYPFMGTVRSVEVTPADE